MIDGDDFLAARYALGVASLTEITIAETRLQSDPTFANLVAHYDTLFSGLEEDGAFSTPSDVVWSRIEEAIDDLEKVPGTGTIRSEAMSWEPFVPGVERKILHVDKDNMTGLVLYKVAPGGQVGNHGHGITEECVVLDGEVEVDGITLRPGDLHLAFPGKRHGPLSSKTGAIVYIRGDLIVHP